MIWFVALALLTAVRLGVAATAPLSPDEAYYWTWSHALAPGYLDHPPMTALWIHAGTLLFDDTPLGVRLFSPLAAAMGTLLLASSCADLLQGPACARSRRPLAAAVMLNATLLLGAGAVTITPDTPLLFFWTAALAALGRLVATRRGAWWLAVGIAIGLALDSKYTVVLPGAGLALWLAATAPGRCWLRTPWPWLAVLIALLLFAPVLFWNAAHGWVSFLKQGGRTGVWRPAKAGRYLGELLGGQIGLATPLIFVLAVRGLARMARHPLSGAAGHTLLVWVTLPALLVFTEHAFGDRVQANWPGLLYPAGAIAAASQPARWWRPAAALGFALSGLLYLQSTVAPLPLPRKLDITLVRLAGWDGLAAKVAAAEGSVDGFIMSDEYGLASELAFARPDRPVFGVEPRWRQFAMAHPDLGAQSGLLIRSARRKDMPDAKLFRIVHVLGELRRLRAGRLAETYHLYRVTMRSGLAPDRAAEIVRLPSPRR